MTKQVVRVTLTPDLLAALDTWIASQSAPLTRARAIVVALEDWLVVQRALGLSPKAQT